MFSGFPQERSVAFSDKPSRCLFWCARCCPSGRVREDSDAVPSVAGGLVDEAAVPWRLCGGLADAERPRRLHDLPRGAAKAG